MLQRGTQVLDRSWMWLKKSCHMPWKIEMTKSLIPVCENTYTSSSTDITRKTRNPSCSGWKTSFAYFCSSGPGMMIHTKHCKYQVKCSILIDFSRVLRRRVTLFIRNHLISLYIYICILELLEIPLSHLAILAAFFSGVLLWVIIIPNKLTSLSQFKSLNYPVNQGFSMAHLSLNVPSGKRVHNYGKIHPFHG